METPAALTPDIWERTPPEAQAYIGALESRLSALEARVHALQEQNGTLQERLNPTSRNSSRPPSSDPPQSPRPRRPRSGRRRGGQPGHAGHTRTLLPVAEVDEVVAIKPESCVHCHAPLGGDDPAPFRHQVIEIPPIQPVVTEYQWHQLRCPTCGETTRAPWPKGVPSGTYGPRVLLVDELDKASFDLPNDLLHVFEEGAFALPELVRLGGEQAVYAFDSHSGDDRVLVSEGRISTFHHPVVVITSNGERSFSEAFLRRCVRLDLKQPGREHLELVVTSQLGDSLPEKLVGQALERYRDQTTDVLLQALFLEHTYGVGANDVDNALRRGN